MDEVKRRPPHELWAQAEREGANPEQRRVRYHELTVEHGHIVPGPRRNLPCGWPGERRR